MGKPSSPPPAPDYAAAAREQTKSNRYNQVTPYGNMTWTQAAPQGQQNPYDPNGGIFEQARYKGWSNSNPGAGEGQWTSTIDLDPRAQQTLDTQLQLSNEMGDLTLGQLGNVRDTYSKPLDLSSVPEIADKAYGALTSRLDPQWAQREQQVQTQLANQGLVSGGEAYSNAMRDFNNARNDAYQQANLAAIQTMPQTYQLATSAYNQPLNQLNALRTGAQIQNPQFQQQGGGTNYLGAAQAQGQYNQGLYNADVAQRNAMMSGLFGLGAAGLVGAGSAGGFPQLFGIS